ncbi:MAG: DUF3160 domain-containing protein [Candidatus Falkowbacteria bacterium]
MFNKIEPSQITQVTQEGNTVVPPVDISKTKRTRIIWIIVAASLCLIVLLVIIFRKTPTPAPVKPAATSTFGFLPVEVSTNVVATTTATSSDEFEKYNFSDYYQEPAPIPEFSFKDYTLPLNIKIDALNYYDISRKLSLDSGLDSLNNNGFAVLDNPAPKEATSFYSAYSWLSDKEIPLLITSDFLIHYHQNTVKQISKDIEENIFYDNMWRISKMLYESSKNRYEARLAKIGNVNDQVLESERLATAYFAVALKLLEPTPAQINTTGQDDNKFSKSEAGALYFTILPYLQVDAAEEVRLIKEASVKTKSPVLLYTQNYTDFVVPAEYRRTEKLYNFYLASTWLNSVFPLVVKDKNCPDCLLDKDDAKLSLIASSFITKDFSANQDLKNMWALVYKLMSYSKGLRDDLTYRHYDEAMKTLFGETYDPEVLFAEDNPDSAANMDKMRAKLLSIPFSDFQGALDKTKDKPRLGFKLLSDYYFPNEYVFNRLSGDAVGNYGEIKPRYGNSTVCKEDLKRCNGFGLDVIGLVADKLTTDSYWMDNTNFASYDEKLLVLKNELKTLLIWHNNNFWSTLSTIKAVFETNNGQMQAYSRADSWRQHLIDVSTSAWVDMQLPLEKLAPTSAPLKKGLSNDVIFNDNFYIEPNYALIQKLIADNEMIYGMFDAMGVNKKVSAVSLALKEENSKLRQFSDLIKKELNGEAFSSDNQSFISSVAKQYQLDQAPASRLFLKAGKATLYEDLGIKFMVLFYELRGEKYLAAGPVYSYQESR